MLCILVSFHFCLRCSKQGGAGWGARGPQVKNLLGRNMLDFTIVIQLTEIHSPLKSFKCFVCTWLAYVKHCNRVQSRKTNSHRWFISWHKSVLCFYFSSNSPFLTFYILLCSSTWREHKHLKNVAVAGEFGACFIRPFFNSYPCFL